MSDSANLPGGGAIGCDLERAGACIALRTRCQDVARQTIGQRRLADALGTCEQPSVVHATACEGLSQLSLGLRVAKKLSRLARVREAIEAVGLGQRFVFVLGWCPGHQRASDSRRCSTSAQISAATMSVGFIASTRAHRRGSALASAA